MNEQDRSADTTAEFLRTMANVIGMSTEKNGS
jgi:hypothetical protein